MSEVELILGTLAFGPQVEPAGGRAMVQRFREAGYRELDTAYVYNDGAAETILGSILKNTLDNSFAIATKVHPRVTGKLDAHAVNMQVEESLRRLSRERIDTLYLHFPDPNTPVAEALEACANLHKQGKIKELGLSNYPAKMVIDIWHLCKERGWPKPSVYQGLYNGLSRSVEKELFPVLRKLSIRFFAYNPLAGGLLSGKHTCYKDKLPPGRFALRKSYRERYWKKSFFKAVSMIATACRKENIEPTEAAFQWLVHHSCLDPSQGDGIVVGASSIEQLEQNLASVKKGALPKSVLQAFDMAWEIVISESPDYVRYFTQKNP